MNAKEARAIADAVNGVGTQTRIDELLDKVNENGYDSLSDKEKELLDKYSKKI